MEFIELSSPEAEAILASAPFQTHARMTQIAMAERPAGFIADEAMPRVDAPYKFKYTKGDNLDRFSLPDNRASRSGRMNEVEFGAVLADGSTDDFGLLAYVPYRDIDEARQQQSAWDPLAQASSGLGQLMALRREKRVADLVTATESYAEGHSTTLAGEAQWSDAANSDPVKAISDALDMPITRPNTLVIGRGAWTPLRRHPKIVDAITMRGAGGVAAAGLVSRQGVADLFELDRVLVGDTWYQSANRGQAAGYSRIWGKHAALLHIRRPAGTQDMMPTWGFTAQAMALEIAMSEEPSRGVGRGSRAVKASECIQELVSWNSAGYLFRSAAA